MAPSPYSSIGICQGRFGNHGYQPALAAGRALPRMLRRRYHSGMALRPEMWSGAWRCTGKATSSLLPEPRRQGKQRAGAVRHDRGLRPRGRRAPASLCWKLTGGNRRAHATPGPDAGHQAPYRRQGRQRPHPRVAGDPRRSPRLQERSLRRHPQVGHRGDRAQPRPRQGRQPGFDRRPARGRRAGGVRRSAERRQVLAAAGPVEHPDQDRRLSVHHAPARSGADADPRRAGAAGRDPGADLRRGRGSRRRAGAARRAPRRRRHRLLPRGLGDARRAPGRPRGGRRGRDREAVAAGGHEVGRRGRRRAARSSSACDPRPPVCR